MKNKTAMSVLSQTQPLGLKEPKNQDTLVKVIRNKSSGKYEVTHIHSNKCIITTGLLLENVQISADCSDRVRDPWCGTCQANLVGNLVSASEDEANSLFIQGNHTQLHFDYEKVDGTSPFWYSMNDFKTDEMTYVNVAPSMLIYGSNAYIPKK